MDQSTYEGLQKSIRHLKSPAIEVWENQYPDRDYTIVIEIPEFTCICPKTGLPDFAVIELTYVPDRWCLELKSFKYYTIFFRDIGIFNEHVVNRIMDDVVKACAPRRLEIRGEFNARGGIKTTVSAAYTKTAGRKR